MRVPEFVAAAAADETILAASAIDAIRRSYPVDAAVSQAVASDIQAIDIAAGVLFDPGGAKQADIANLVAALGLTPAPSNGAGAIAAALTATIAKLASGMTPPVAQDAMAYLCDLFDLPPASGPFLSQNVANAAQNVAGIQQIVRLAALTAWADAVVGRTYTDRPSGVTARAEAAERFERELARCQGQDYAALYLALETLQGAVVQYLTKLIADLAPVITIVTPASLRNEVRHPSFLPREFDALAPGYNAPGIPTEWPAPPL
jgi:hypothetical protein